SGLESGAGGTHGSFGNHAGDQSDVRGLFYVLFHFGLKASQRNGVWFAGIGKRAQSFGSSPSYHAADPLFGWGRGGTCCSRFERSLGGAWLSSVPGDAGRL